MKQPKKTSALVHNPNRVAAELKISAATKKPNPKKSGTQKSGPKTTGNKKLKPGPVAAPKITRRPNRIAGLDSLRAIAVGIVIAYHFFPQAVPGGFIGVDVFFVISGFLITSLLLREFQVTRHISLRDFWLRRARRLLPALALMVTVTTAAAGIIGQDATVGLPSQVLGAASFSSNWVYIAQGTSYSATLTPSLFANLWSLAVEEQFYLVWPLIVVAALGFGAKRIKPQYLVLATGLIVVGSAAAMALMFDPLTDPSRIYFGTDTHLFGIMLGALLAMVRRPHPDGSWPALLAGGSRVSIARNKMATVTLGVVSLAGLLWATLGLHFDAAITYRGGLLFVSLCTAGLITAILSGQRAAGRLEKTPVRWIGRHSYGLYLWHWPVLILATYVLQNRNVGTNVSALTAITALTIIVLASWASYKYVEYPIIKHGFKPFVARVRTAVTRLWTAGPAAKGELGTYIGTVLLVVVLAITALVTSPRESSIEQGIAEGEAALQEPLDWTSLAQLIPPLPTPEVPATAMETTPEETAALQPAEEEPEPAVEVKPEPVAPPGDQVTVIGDSVTLASVDAIKQTLPGVVIDAKTSRFMHEVAQVMTDLDAKGKLGRYVVVALGTNGLVSDQDVDKIAKIAGDRTVVLVTAHGERSWIGPGNEAVLASAQRVPNVYVADWDKVISEHPDELARDGIHPRPEGGQRFASEIARVLALAANQ